jgi:hypothetical protein
MKRFSLLLIALTAFLVTSQAQATRFTNRNNDERVANRITTADATPVYIDSLVLRTNEAGIIQVTIIGYAKDTAYAVTGVKQARFNKRRGTLTLGTVTDLLTTTTDTDISGATFSIISSGNKIYVQVTGKAATSITWTCFVKAKTVSTGT